MSEPRLVHRPTEQRIHRLRVVSRVSLWGSFGLGVAVVVLDLWQGAYHLAVVNAVFTAVVLNAIAVLPTFHQRLDALLAQAIAQQRTAELAFKVLEREGRVQIEVGHGPMPQRFN